MTRINLVPPDELHNKHLMAEIHELPRAFTLAKKSKHRLTDLPKQYTMGKGHVLFFYNKLGFLSKRYESICNEALKRGFRIKPIPTRELLDGSSVHIRTDWQPTESDISINRQRIQQRLSEMKEP